jgi:hypothetical protein
MGNCAAAHAAIAGDTSDFDSAFRAAFANTETYMAQFVRDHTVVDPDGIVSLVVFASAFDVYLWERQPGYRAMGTEWLSIYFGAVCEGLKHSSALAGVRIVGHSQNAHGFDRREWLEDQARFRCVVGRRLVDTARLDAPAAPTAAATPAAPVEFAQ